jgi:hypothetical protein
MILTGLRGTGKTVLLNRIESIAQADGFQALLIEAHENKPLPALIAPPVRKILFSLATGEKVKRGIRVLASFIRGFKTRVSMGEIEWEVGFDPEKGTADSGDLEADLAELFISARRN